MATLFGIEILVRDYVPLNEVWIVSKSDKPVKIEIVKRERK